MVITKNLFEFRFAISGTPSILCNDLGNTLSLLCRIGDSYGDDGFSFDPVLNGKDSSKMQISSVRCPLLVECYFDKSNERYRNDLVDEPI